MAKAPARTPDSEAAGIAASTALRRQIFFWLASAVLLALFLYVFSGILLPFVAGMVLAYFLDPVADRLERLGLSRLMATIVILIAFIVIVVLAFVILVPVLATQMADFARKLPEYLTRLQSLITSFDPKWLEQRFGVTEDYLMSHIDWSAVIAVGEPAVSTLLDRWEELTEAIAPRWRPSAVERPGEIWVGLHRARARFLKALQEIEAGSRKGGSTS